MTVLHRILLWKSSGKMASGMTGSRGSDGVMGVRVCALSLFLSVSSVLASLFSSRIQYACLRSLSPEEDTWQLIRSTSDIFLGSKITADGDCSHEIKRHLLLGRKVMTNPDSILKSRDITLSTKVHLVKAMVFPVVIYGCESWTVKKAEHRRIDAFDLWCWRRLLRVPWTARRSSQSILKEISPEYSLEGLMFWSWNSNTLATWCGELTHWKRPRSWIRLKVGGERDNRGLDGWMVLLTQWIWVWVNSESWWWTGRPGMLWFMGSQRVGHNWATELNWSKNIRCLLHGDTKINNSWFHVANVSILRPQSGTHLQGRDKGWTGRPGRLRFMKLQWDTTDRLNWTEPKWV